MLKWFLYICIATLSLGQFAKFGMVGDSKLYLFDILIILFGLLGTFFFLIRKEFKISKYLILFFVFCFIASLSLIYNFHTLTKEEFIVAFSYLGRLFSYILSANVVYNLIDKGKLTVRELVRAFMYSGVFISIVGFIQYVVLPDFTILDPSLGWDPHKNRLASTFFDPNYTGVYLTLVFTLFLFKDLFFTKKELEEKKKVFIAGLIIVLSAIFLTYSRSTWGMLGVLILIYGWFKSKKLVFLALLIAFSAYFAVPRIQTRLAGITDPADSAHFRLISWKNTMEISKDNLFLGVGYNAFKKAQVDYGFLTPDSIKEHSSTGSDSSLLLVLATTGVLGLFIFLIALGYPLVSSRSLFGAIIIVPLVLQSSFTNSLFFPQILMLWLCTLLILDKGFN
ncbi:O-antigen ligase family protein [Patescibacteria group bacterium]